MSLFLYFIGSFLLCLTSLFLLTMVGIFVIKQLDK